MPRSNGVIARRPEGEWQPSVKRTTNQHDADGKDLLSIGVGTDISEAHAGQAAEGEVQGGDVRAADCRAAHCVVNVWSVQTSAQLMKPALNAQTVHMLSLCSSAPWRMTVTGWYCYILSKISKASCLFSLLLSFSQNEI